MPYKTKHKTTDLSKVDQNLIAYLQTLPQDLQDKIFVTAGTDGKHSEKSRHYSGKALDLRFDQDIWNYIEKDPNRHRMGLTLLDPDHGSAKHIHLSTGQGSENNMDVDLTGRQSYLSGNPTPIQSRPYTPPVLGSSKWLDIETYTPATSLNAPVSSPGVVDYGLWNQYGWADGMFINPQGQTQSNFKPGQDEEAFNILLNNITNPTLKTALQTAFGFQKEKIKTKNKKRTNSYNWIDEMEQVDEENIQTRRKRNTYNSPVQGNYNISGDWASRFSRVEDPNRKFNHGNGAYGTFGYRQSGHLKDAFNSPQFSDIRSQYSSYNDFWNDFKSRGYSPLSTRVDQLYEGWLKEKTGGDFSKAARFNYAGYEGLKQSSDFVPEGNKMSLGEYEQRMLRQNGGEITSGYKDWLNKYDLQETTDYNLKRAYELGYTPDETGHLPSVDEETGEWLKSDKHPTAWMEFQEYNLNPEINKNYSLIRNDKGNLQYISKKEQGGNLTKEKAKKMLSEGVANGKSLTEKQKRYFGWIAGGKKQQGGQISYINNTGYTEGSSTEDNKINIIPNNEITMKNVSYPVIGIDNTGVSKIMMPEEDYKFPGSFVTEIPLKKDWLKMFD